MRVIIRKVNHLSKVEKLPHNSPGLSVATEQLGSPYDGR